MTLDEGRERGLSRLDRFCLFLDVNGLSTDSKDTVNCEKNYRIKLYREKLTYINSICRTTKYMYVSSLKVTVKPTHSHTAFSWILNDNIV